MNISEDKQSLLKIMVPRNAYIVTGEAGTGKTFAGVLCAARLLSKTPKWQRVLYLTYSKLAKWQIIETATKLVSHGLVDRETRERIDIQNYHSLWWDMICKHHSFLGIRPLPRLWLVSELRRLVKDELDRLPLKERLDIVPRQFLRQSDHGLNENKRGRLEQALCGEALLYDKWGCEHYGKDAKDFGGDGATFLLWASNQIKIRNRSGMFSHDETVWWACKLLETHPNAASLMKALYPAMIIDEFQDVDISQWETVKLISSETIVAMGDTKQTIHRWRGADPERRFADLSAYCSDPARYSRVIPFELTEKNRSPRDMSLAKNIQVSLIKLASEDWINKTKVLSRCKSHVIDSLKARHGTIGIMCASNKLAEDTSAHLRQMQRNQNDGSVFGPHIWCARLGAGNSPFESARELLVELIEREGNPDALSLYVANDVAWRIIGLSRSKMPECGKRSKKEEPVLRWNSAHGIARNLMADFGRGLLSIRDFVLSVSYYHECCFDRQLLGCVLHAGTTIAHMGPRYWKRLSIVEKKHRIDGLILQYENAQAGRMRERVYVMTVHQAKGREFNTVIIPWFVSEKWDPSDAHSWDLTEPDVTEIFHTACTRAKGENARVITIGIRT